MGRTNIAGGGLNISGIIEEYQVASGGNVNAGDFVKYINNLSIENDTQLSSVQYSGYTMSAVLLEDNKVFIAHSYSNSYYLYGIVCTINGTTITAGSDTQLCTTTNTGNAISVVLLAENKVFIAHNQSNSYFLFGMVCTISGTTITIGSNTQLQVTRSGNYISTILLDDGKVFIAHNYSNTICLYGIVCTINGTNIIVGTDTQLSSVQYSGYSISAVLLEENKVFIAHSYSNSYYLYGIVCTINGTTITAGSDTQLVLNDSTGYGMQVVLLENNKIFIAHRNLETYYNILYGIICTIVGINIIAEQDTQLLSETTVDTASKISIIALSNEKVFIGHNYSSNYYLYGLECIISGTTIISGTDIQLSNFENASFSIVSVKLQDNRIATIHDYDSNRYLYGMIFNNEELIKQLESASDDIFGVAKTSGTAGELVQTYVPDV